MKLGILFSGGKDSAYACWLAMQKNDVSCLISVLSKNEESYMFHTPNISLTQMQAEAAGIPLIAVETAGEKEKELEELKTAISKAIEKYDIGGIVTGAVESVYQATRIEKICDALGLYCFNPLWQKDQVELLKEVVALDFSVIISGVFAEPFNEKWLGKVIDDVMIDKLILLAEKYKINPAGEGGEIETTVIDAPFFHKRIKLKSGSIEYSNYSGSLKIEEAYLVEK